MQSHRRTGCPRAARPGRRHRKADREWRRGSRWHPAHRPARKLAVSHDQRERGVDVRVGGAAVITAATAAITAVPLPVHQPIRAGSLIVVARARRTSADRPCRPRSPCRSQRPRSACRCWSPGNARARRPEGTLDHRLSPIEIELTQLVRRQRVGGDAAPRRWCWEKRTARRVPEPTPRRCRPAPRCRRRAPEQRGR